MRPEVIFESPDPAIPLAVSMPPDVLGKAEMMKSAVTMPISWEQRMIYKKKGQAKGFMWQGVYHVYDADKFRRDEPFPPRTAGRARIIAIGDSRTYGKAIADFWTYPAQLERRLEQDIDVEVLNLGSPGLSSEEILGKLRTHLPMLDPDLVFFGVSLNDFEPVEYESEKRMVVPIPRSIEKYIIRRTRVGRFIDHRYGQLMRDLGVRHDRYSKILVDFDARSARFGRDVAEMNALVREAGLPPMIAMVLNADTSGDERNQKMVEVAEEKLRGAGMTVIESDPFVRSFAGRDFAVSRWDRHPDEEANAIWAKVLWQHLGERPELERYRRAQNRN